jgi:sigma-B regulation protein RsbU (phosphoserine phosphatase)
LLVDPQAMHGIAAAVHFMPAMEAGGDFYDAIQLAEGCYGFFVADVSGHDLSVAYLTGALKALTASFTSDSLTVSDTMVMMNGALKKFLPLGRYATASYAMFMRQTMTVDVVCAGHPAPLLHAKGDRPRYIDVVGDVLGVYDSITCDVRSVSVAEGDRLFMYTDGLIEGVPTPTGSTSDRRHGSEWLRRKVSAYREQPIQQAVSQIISELARARNGRLDDDVLLMGVEF